MTEYREQLLPDPLLSLQKEFANTIGVQGERLGIGNKMLRWLKRPQVLVPIAIGLTAAATFVPGVIEGLAQGQTFLDAIRYSVTSTPLSTIWEASPQGSIREVIEKYMLALRATIVPAVTGGAIVTGFLTLVERARKLGESIRHGTARIERKSTQRFVLNGENSYVGDVLYNVMPNNVIPIVERPEAMRRVLTGKESKGTFVTIPDGEYGQAGRRSAWSLLRVTKDWLLSTKQGKLLLVYGLGETKDEELPLTEEPLVDVTVEELSLAATKIEEQARLHKVKPDRVVKIYLGNPERRRMRGTAAGLREVTDRDVAEGTVDIYVDAGKTVAQALQEMIGRESTVGFETGVAEYWTGMKKLAQTIGLTVHDENNPDDGKAVLLVYEKHTDESVQSAMNLKRKNPGRRIIVLTSSIESHTQALKAGVESLCVAEVLARKLLEVEQRLINGETPEVIQQALLTN